MAQNFAFGFLNASTILPGGATGASTIQVNYYFPDNLSSPATVGQLPHTTTTSPVYTITNLNQTGNVVEVRVNNYPWNWMIPLPNFMPGTSISMSSSSLDVLQGLPIGTFTYPTP